MTKGRGKDGIISFAVAQSQLGLTPRESTSQGKITCYSLSHINGLLPQKGKNLVPLFLTPLMLDLVIV